MKKITLDSLPRVSGYGSCCAEGGQLLHAPHGKQREPKNHGEVVGINVYAGGLGQVGQHIDLLFPGGGLYTVKDEVKARRLVDIIEREELPAFTYVYCQ